LNLHTVDLVVLKHSNSKQNEIKMTRKTKKIFTAVRRFNGDRLNDELLDDLIIANGFFTEPSPGTSLEILYPVFEKSLLVLTGLSLSCFFCNSSICALCKKKKKYKKR
jgi:hypothetical protein